MQEITIIVKPTLACNIRCRHCAVKHDSFINDDVDFYRIAVDKIVEFRRIYLGHETKRIELIWHGGEPMLLPPEFYEKVSLLLEKSFPEVEFQHSMQTNLLLYGKKWKPVFEKVFHWRIGTSYDFFSSFRPYNADKFIKLVKKFQDDSSSPGYVICVLSRENYEKVLEICDIANTNGFDLRLNYLYAVGSAVNLPEFTPDMYGKALVIVARNRNLFTKVRIDPVDFFKEFKEGKRRFLPCPYTTACGETIFSVYPDGRIFNCAELADIDYFCYGNVEIGINPEIYFSLQFQKAISSKKCFECGICGGGCLKQRVLAGDVSKPTPYCQVWRSLLSEV